MLTLLFISCTSINTVTETSETTYSCKEHPVLMEIEVVRVMEDFSYNEPVTFGENSIGTASLLGGVEGGEWIAEYQFDTIFSPVPELPFLVSICGSSDAITAQDHLISIELNQKR